MKIKSDEVKENLPDWAFERPFNRCFPVVFLFCKKDNNIEILESDVGAGSPRLMPDDYKYNETGYDDNYLVRKSKCAFENGANCVITGYYNTIEEVWVQYKIYEIDGEYTTAKNIDIVNETMIFCHNASYYNEDCYLENIKEFSTSFGYRFTDLPKHITVLKVYDFMKKSFFKNNKLKDDVSGLYYIKNPDIETFFKENNIPLNSKNIHDLFNIMRVAHVGNVFVVENDIEKPFLIEYFNMGHEVAQKILDKPKSFSMMYGYHERFISVIGEIN